MGTLSGIGYPLAHLLLFLSFFLAESRDFLSDQHRGNNAYLTRDEHWFNQTLDHFSPTVCLHFSFFGFSCPLLLLKDSCNDHRKFGQRFYEFLDYYQVSKGPIFLKICGESACNGIVNDYTSVKLTVSIALFLLQEYLNAKYNISETENPWFVFGVSYSGALSAWFRLKFPHLTCGSLASSAVVLAVYNFTEFDQQVLEIFCFLYRPVRTGPAADWYADRSLPGGTAKIGRWRSILAVGGRLREKSIVGSRLRKKKGRERRGKEERRRRGEEVPRPRTLAARGRLFSLREETEHLPRVERDRGDVPYRHVIILWLQLKNDNDFLYLLADAAAIAFQYGNPDILCTPLVDAKKNGSNLLKKREKNLEFVARAIRCPQAISSPRAGRRNISPCEEKERGNVGKDRISTGMIGIEPISPDIESCNGYRLVEGYPRTDPLSD
ncbi:hypothetical protein GW17_00015638 [Ensete ventricosum]|nr:hypothetical protein GW17_00015638 [Ensete ventricosum]